MKQKFTFREPIIDETHWKFGSSPLPLIPLLASGDWSDFLPTPEAQSKRGVETYDCTGFATLNAIEALMFMLFGQKVNYSDRFLGIVAGTGKGGNDPHTVCEAIRKHGVIPEEMLPFSDDISSIEEYYSFKGANEEACRKAGQEWLTKYNFNHEWVFDRGQSKSQKIDAMKASLTASPLGISVFAWEEGNGGVYIEDGSPNHWTNGYAQTNVTYVFDSYDPFLKLVDQDYLFCKRYFVSLKADDESKKKSLYEKIQEIINVIKAYLGILQVKVDAVPKQEEVVVVPAVEPNRPVEHVEPTSAKYLWVTPTQARTSFRMICDEEFGVGHTTIIDGVTYITKDLLCQVLNCESGFRTTTVHPNNDARKSTDFGVAEVETNKLGMAQFNDYWYKDIISPDDALNNPEKASRVFIAQFKAGKLKNWVCYSSGKYKNYKS